MNPLIFIAVLFVIVFVGSELDRRLGNRKLKKSTVTGAFIILTIVALFFCLDAYDRNRTKAKIREVAEGRKKDPLAEKWQREMDDRRLKVKMTELIEEAEKQKKEKEANTRVEAAIDRVAQGKTVEGSEWEKMSPGLRKAIIEEGRAKAEVERLRRELSQSAD